MKRLTNEEFSQKVGKRYPELRQVTEYRNSRTPIQMRCTRRDKLNKEHGVFTIRDPSSFLYGRNNRNGCKKCANEARSEAKTKYTFDEDFFSTFTPQSCYWAGFIAADGCIQDDKHLSIKLTRKDKPHLERFSTDLGYTGVIYEGSGKNNFGIGKEKYNTGHHSHCTFWLGNAQKLIHDLQQNFNIGPRKSTSYTHPDGLTDDQALAFIKGYIDGDGHIQRGKRTRITICGTKETLEWIKGVFDRLFPPRSLNGLVAGVRQHSQSSNLWMYEVGHNRATQILESLSSLETPALKRKWC